VLATLLLTLAVFTLVLLLGNVLKEVLPLVVSGFVSVGMFGEAVGLLLPWIWSYSLPMAMLASTLLVFGRFSADNELTAVRASGISLVSLVSPVLLLSLAMCALSALVNLEIGPRFRESYKSLIFRVGTEISKAQWPEGKFIKDFPGFIFYVGKQHSGALEDVTVIVLPQKTNDPTTITVMAPRGQLVVDEVKQEFSMKLQEVQFVVVHDDRVDAGMTLGEWETPAVSFAAKSRRNKGTGSMTFNELRAELRDTERRFGATATTNLTRAQGRELMAKLRRSRDELTTPLRVEMHRKLATSFACFGFALVGIPLGIRVHRRETNIGFVIALGLVMVYYGIMVTGLGLDTRPEFAPHLLVWVPNFLFQAVGAVLLWRANRGV
jgi:lipopolysaccharide export system permease protein